MTTKNNRYLPVLSYTNAHLPIQGRKWLIICLLALVLSVAMLFTTSRLFLQKEPSQKWLFTSRDKEVTLYYRGKALGQLPLELTASDLARLGMPKDVDWEAWPATNELYEGIFFTFSNGFCDGFSASSPDSDHFYTISTPWGLRTRCQASVSRMGSGSTLEVNISLKRKSSAVWWQILSVTTNRQQNTVTMSAHNTGNHLIELVDPEVTLFMSSISPQPQVRPVHVHRMKGNLMIPPLGNSTVEVTFEMNPLPGPYILSAQVNGEMSSGMYFNAP